MYKKQHLVTLQLCIRYTGGIITKLLKFAKANFPFGTLKTFMITRSKQLYPAAKETWKRVTFKLIKNKTCWIQEMYVTCKTNCITCNTISFTCNIHFLNPTHFIFNQFKSDKFSSFFCCWEYYAQNNAFYAYKLNSTAKCFLVATIFQLRWNWNCALSGRPFYPSLQFIFSFFT